MEDRMEIIEKAKKEGRTLLSESESKQLLAGYKIPITKEVIVMIWQKQLRILGFLWSLREIHQTSLTRLRRG